MERQIIFGQFATCATGGSYHKEFSNEFKHGRLLICYKGANKATTFLVNDLKQLLLLEDADILIARAEHSLPCKHCKKNNTCKAQHTCPTAKENKYTWGCEDDSYVPLSVVKEMISFVNSQKING